MTRVELHDVGHSFARATHLFTGIDHVFRQGELTAVVGPSGCGKSTLLNIIAGWVTPTRGVVQRIDVDSMSWVFQNPFGVPRRSVLDHVVLPLLAAGWRRSEATRAASDILAEFALDELSAQMMREISGGEAQRLMLARAVAAAPDLLLVDEPTAQLDTGTSQSVNEALARLSKRGMIVIVATHDPGTRDSCQYVIDLAHYGDCTAAL